jgi:replicative DNA helicase
MTDVAVLAEMTIEDREEVSVMEVEREVLRVDSKEDGRVAMMIALDHLETKTADQ